MKCLISTIVLAQTGYTRKKCCHHRKTVVTTTRVRRTVLSADACSGIGTSSGTYNGISTCNGHKANTKTTSKPIVATITRAHCKIIFSMTCHVIAEHILLRLLHGVHHGTQTVTITTVHPRMVTIRKTVIVAVKTPKMKTTCLTTKDISPWTPI